ncbi:segregation/condensation protein A [Macrococcus brunensis]|uniref:Segregation and condensation protein A n=1 Tax=Macrococcus brunensis TaxID=198483 RepID=A0A4R6BDI7_9STAP|nr:segregation/condensation protein A [Macrococcus brunensis]TDL97841.1 segregation/condensation protein A [Macrococcus brunensis]ULG71049.1 segregation/condensation protein A [Macrococcus brunensis]ULG73385.1 segregation/condensation protein A [Macrococcus brunensis]
MYEVKLDAFEGPLDLLLHLIKKLEIDIYDISMKHLTEQYLHYINSMSEWDINIQGEYLVMASELLRIKSRMLLPAIEEDEEDPREELMTQLIEYQNYKYYATLLGEKREAASDHFVKAPQDLSGFEKAEPAELVLKLTDLIAAYEKAKSRKKRVAPVMTVSRENYTIQQATTVIQDRLKRSSQIKFTELFHFSETKHQLITLFMAMLEMMKNQEIKVEQQELFGEIYIEKGV